MKNLNLIYVLSMFAKKLSQMCGIFCYLRYNICKKTLLMLYYSLVNSHILYRILVWGSTNHSILQQLQVLQNKIIRIFCNVSKSEHVKNNILYHELKLLKAGHGMEWKTIFPYSLLAIFFHSISIPY